MDILAKIAEEKIKQAMENGEFDHLPGKGKPLELEDLSHVPEDLRAGYKLLKNAGVIPEEMQLQKEMISLQNLIDCCYDEEQKTRLKKTLNEKRLRFQFLMERRNMASSAAWSAYRHKILGKF